MADPTVSFVQLSYTEDDPAQIIDSGAGAGDGDTPPDWGNGASLTARISSNADPNDELSIQDEGKIAVDKPDVKYDGTKFGTISETSGTDDDGVVSGGDTLTVNFDGDANNANVQGLAQALAFRNTSDDPGSATRNLEVTVTDTTGASGTSNSNINVNPTNDAPSFGGGSTVNVNEGASATLQTADVTANDPDDSGADLTYTLASAPAPGTLLVGGTALSASETFTQADLTAGDVEYTHDGSENPNTDSFALDLQDDDGGTAPSSATINVTISAVNDAPTLSTNLPTTLSEGGETLIPTSKLGATDPEQSPSNLTYTLDAEPANGKLFIDGNGNDTFDSGEELSSTDTFTQNNINNDDLFYSHDGGETTSDSFDITVKDGNGGSTGSKTVDLDVTPVNEAPSIAGATTLDLNEGATVAVQAADVTADDPDDSGGGLTYTLTAAPSKGTLFKDGNTNDSLDMGEGLAKSDTFTEADLDGGNVQYTHDGSETTSDSFDLKLSDGDEDGAGDATATVKVNITAVNDAPTITTNTGATLNENATKDISGSELKANDADNTDANLTYTIDTLPADGALVIDDTGSGSDDGTQDGENALTASDTFQQSVLGNSDLLYVHDGAENSSDSFAFTVSDSSGGSVSDTFDLTINGVNDAPNPSNDSVSAQSNQAKTFTVLGNDSDPEGQSLDVTGTGAPGNGTATANKDDTITYTSGEGFTGSDSFTYTVQDASGATATATVDVTVTPDVNDDPNATNDAISVDEDKTVNADVLANDSDPDTDELSVTLNTTPSNGDATVTDGDKIAYTPDPDFNGSDSVSYTLADGNGGTDTATVAFTVNAVNDVPTAKDDDLPAAADTTTDLNVLANDDDTESGNNLEVTLNATPANAQLAVNVDDTIAFTPDPGFTGETSFTYTARDPEGATDTANVTVTVSESGGSGASGSGSGSESGSGGNDVSGGSGAVADSFTIKEDTEAATLKVLDNDSGFGDKLEVTLTDSADHGKADPNDDNTLAYTPDADFAGSDSLVYKVEDLKTAESDTASVDITVTEINDAPVANPDTALVGSGQANDVNVTINDRDVDGDDLSVSIKQAPANGDVVVADDEAITYTPDPGFTGTDSLTYTLSDGRGGTATAEVALTVKDEPPAVFLTKDSSFAAVDRADIVGRADGTERVFLASDVTGAAIDANVDRLDINRPLGELMFEVTGDGLTISAGATPVVTIPSLNQPLDIRFADGDARLTQTGATTFELAGRVTDTTVIGTSATAAEVELGGNPATPPDPSAAGGSGANIFLGAGNTAAVFDTATVFGRPDSDDGVRLSDTATDVTLDASVHRLDIPDDLGDLTFQVGGGGLTIGDGDATLVTIPSLNQPMDINFGDGNAGLRQTAAQTFELIGGSTGSAEIGTEATTPDVELGDTTAEPVQTVGTSESGGSGGDMMDGG